MIVPGLDCQRMDFPSAKNKILCSNYGRTKIQSSTWIFVVLFAFVGLSAQDAPEWYFGYYSTMKFEKSGVAPGRWLDTNYVAP